MHYARVMPVKGGGVYRRTPTYKSERGLQLGIKRECLRIRQQGPYLVQCYAGLDGPVLRSFITD